MEFVVFAEGRIDDFLQGSWVDLDHLDQLAECHPHLACQQFNMPPQLRLVGQYHPFLLHHHHHHIVIKMLTTKMRIQRMFSATKVRGFRVIGQVQ